MSNNRNSHTAETADGLGTRLIVAYKQIPGNPQKALVIKLDSIVSSVDRDILFSLVQSLDAQHAKDFIDVLHTKGLLALYKQKNYFTTIDIDNIVMSPGDGIRLPLRHVIDSINKMNGLAPLPTKAELDSLIDRNPQSDRLREDVTHTRQNAEIAKTILVQAKMLQDEANRKLEEAYRLDPKLRPIAKQIRSTQLPETPAEINVAALISNEPSVINTPIVKTKKPITKKPTKKVIKK